MSYDHGLLLNKIFYQLRENPRVSTNNICAELKVSRRTIQQVIKLQTGKTLSALREEMLITKVKQLFACHPGTTIKEVSLAVGFQSARSFARAVRRTCGFSPGQLRSHLARSLHGGNEHSLGGVLT